MLNVIFAIAILVPVFGSLLYAMFASSAKRKPTTRMTPFGEVPLTDLDDRDRLIA